MAEGFTADELERLGLLDALGELEAGGFVTSSWDAERACKVWALTDEGRAALHG